MSQHAEGAASARPKRDVELGIFLVGLVGLMVELLHTRMLTNRVANLGLLTQNLQWFILLGLSFVISVYLQTVRGHNAVETGLILTPATIGILAASMLAERMAKRRAQAAVIRGGFLLTAVGIFLLLLFVDSTSNLFTFVPGLLAVGIGVGAMLTASVNVVQSSFGEADQGEISGLSRSVSNLGSSVGVALAGSVIVSPIVTGNQGYSLALVVLIVVALIGVVASWLGPRGMREAAVQAGGTAAGAAQAASRKPDLRRAG